MIKIIIKKKQYLYEYNIFNYICMLNNKSIINILLIFIFV